MAFEQIIVVVIVILFVGISMEKEKIVAFSTKWALQISIHIGVIWENPKLMKLFGAQPK